MRMSSAKYFASRMPDKGMISSGQAPHTVMIDVLCSSLQKNSAMDEKQQNKAHERKSGASIKVVHEVL
jgi:hypothetical protein